MLGLKAKAGVFLIAFGREAHVVELHFVDARLGDELRQGDVVVLHLAVRGIGPDELAVLTPGLAGSMRLDGQFRMRRYQVLVAEDGHARNGVHVFEMQELHELWQIGDVMAVR